MGRKSSHSTEPVWRDRLARFSNSRLTIKEFCRQEGVSAPSFYQWRKRLNKGRQPQPVRRSSGRPATTVKAQPFVPVQVFSSGAAAHVTLAEVELPNGVRIRVPATDAEALRIAILAGNDVCREVS